MQAVKGSGMRLARWRRRPAFVDFLWNIISAGRRESEPDWHQHTRQVRHP